MDLKKILQNNVVTITLWTAGVAFASLNLYFVTQLAPLTKDLALMGDKVEAYEVRLEKLEANSTSTEERKMVMDRLDRIENKLDKIIERELTNVGR